jgi:Zn-dependent peptidase ImmA (M78 family)
MKIPDEWLPREQNIVNEILKEAKDSGLLKTPIPIKDIIESYLGDVHCVAKTGREYPFPEGVSAFSTKDMQNGWIIVANGNESVERQRFSIAHELAHIVLFKNQSKTVYCSRDGRGWDEDLCDRFAGDILMPEIMVREIYKSTPTPYIEDIARTFRVSRPVAEIQLKKLGLPFAAKFAYIGRF